MRNKKWLTMLLCLLVSVGLWAYIVTVENPERDLPLYNIPVVFSGEDILREDYELIISETNVDSGVDLTFSGKLTELNKLQKDKLELQVEVDVSRLRSANEYSFSYDISDITLPGSVSAQNLTLIDRNPSKITVTLDQLAKKTVEVRVVTDVQVVSGYLAERISQDYSEIVIEGPSELVEQVDRAVVTLKRENVDQTITTRLPYTLVDVDGNPVDSTEITSDIAEIEVTLPVSMFKDVPLELPFIDGGGATSDDVTADIEPKTVRISGDPSVIEPIQTLRLSSLDLSSLMSNSETIKRTITMPEGCTNVSGEQEATIKVTVANKAIKQLRVPNTNFQYANVPQGLVPEARTSMLLVTIRADSDDIDEITEENIRVIADFSGVTVADTGGSTTVTVRIYVDGFETAGVIGAEEYSIVVDLNPVDG